MLDFVTGRLWAGMVSEDETSAEAIGRRLKALRLGYGLTQQEINTLLGYTSRKGQAWNNFEIGAKRLTLDGFERLNSRFPVPYTWVYRGEMGDLSAALRAIIRRGESMIADGN